MENRQALKTAHSILLGPLGFGSNSLSFSVLFSYLPCERKENRVFLICNGETMKGVMMAEAVEMFAQDWSLHQQRNTMIQTPNEIDTNDWEKSHVSCVLKTFPGPSETAWGEFLSASIPLQQAANTGITVISSLPFVKSSMQTFPNLGSLGSHAFPLECVGGKVT